MANAKNVQLKTLVSKQDGRVYVYRPTQAFAMLPTYSSYRVMARANRHGLELVSTNIWSPAGMLTGITITAPESSRAGTQLRVGYSYRGELTQRAVACRKEVEFRRTYADMVDEVCDFCGHRAEIRAEAHDLIDGLVETYFENGISLLHPKIEEGFYYNGWPKGLGLKQQLEKAHIGRAYVALRLHGKKHPLLHFRSENFSEFDSRFAGWLEKLRNAPGLTEAFKQRLDNFEAAREIIQSEVELRLIDIAKTMAERAADAKKVRTLA